MTLIWSKVGKLVGSLFLVGGGAVSVGLLVGIVASHAAGGLLAFLSILLVFFGGVPASLGAWLLHASSKAEQQALRERFFQLLQSNRGRLSVLDFAAATRLEPAIARQHLDAWAREFSANFEVSEAGEVYYIFVAEPFSLPENATVQPLSQLVRRMLESVRAELIR